MGHTNVSIRFLHVTLSIVCFFLSRSDNAKKNRKGKTKAKNKDTQDKNEDSDWETAPPMTQRLLDNIMCFERGKKEEDEEKEEEKNITIISEVAHVFLSEELTTPKSIQERSHVERIFLLSEWRRRNNSFLQKEPSQFNPAELTLLRELRAQAKDPASILQGSFFFVPSPL